MSNESACNLKFNEIIQEGTFYIKKIQPDSWGYLLTLWVSFNVWTVGDRKDA